ncbi:DUF6527 family protein [Chitinibacter fontanus]|uniref:DUF6527 family protein n=1 Tax=Chitinibacter fontanus TaxID=1737446 RepID=UPI003570E7D3
MMRIHVLKPLFVRSIPRELETGVLYVSLDYGTAVHCCCCGCGEQVVTPLSPTDWKISYDGDSVSMTPSIGNWQLPCRSHYIIRRGRVIEAEPWSTARVNAAHLRDKVAKVSFYSQENTLDQVQKAQLSDHMKSSTRAPQPTDRPTGFWSSIATWILGDRPKK